LACEAADGGSEIDGSAAAEPVEGRVAQGREVLGRVTAENGAAILVERRIADMMQAVFDGSPMAADELQQSLGIGLMASERGHVIGRLGPPSASMKAFADNSTDLPDLRPVKMPIETNRTRQRPPLATAVSLVTRRRGLSFRSPLLPLVGGKKPPPERQIRARFPAVNRADSL
jgi:hypothetical protein